MIAVFSRKNFHILLKGGKGPCSRQETVTWAASVVVNSTKGAISSPLAFTMFTQSSGDASHRRALNGVSVDTLAHASHFSECRRDGMGGNKMKRFAKMALLAGAFGLALATSASAQSDKKLTI